METLNGPSLYANPTVVATHCLYRDYHALSVGERDPVDTDGVRGDLALELVRKTTSGGMRIVICDGGSSSEFLSALNGFTEKGLTIIGSDILGRGPQRRGAFATVASLPGCEVIAYTQPEKVSLVDYIPELSQRILEGKADIIIPKRDPEPFKQSYPDYMRESELKVNATYDWLMRRANRMKKNERFDWFFGSVVFSNNPEVVSLFFKQYALKGEIMIRRNRIGNVQPNPEMHSNGHYFPVIEALYKRMRVDSVTIPFVYPPTQRANEMSPEKRTEFEKRRKKDAAAYLLEAIHLLAFLKHDPRSQIIEITSNYI